MQVIVRTVGNMKPLEAGKVFTQGLEMLICGKVQCLSCQQMPSHPVLYALCVLVFCSLAPISFILIHPQHKVSVPLSSSVSPPRSLIDHKLSAAMSPFLSWSQMCSLTPFGSVSSVLLFLNSLACPEYLSRLPRLLGQTNSSTII